MPDYRIEPLNDAVFGELSPLMRDAFGDDVNASYFEWKYRGNPAGPAIGNIARDPSDGQIAAFYGMIPEVYRFGQTGKRRVYQSCDTMTHSRHRRKGLFQTLALRTYEQALSDDPNFFAYGFGGPTSTPGFHKMGWRTLLELPNYFHPFPLTMLNLKGGDHRSVSHRDAVSDGLIAMMMHSGPAEGSGVARDEQFLRWRLANPSRTYHYLIDADRAYAIFTASPGFLFLIDFWEAEAGMGRNVWDALRRKALSPRTKGVLSMAAPGSDLAARLKRYSFFRNPFNRGPASGTTPYIAFGTAPLPDASEKWQISPLDHDSF